VAFLLYAAATNAIDNLRRAKIASGFGFISTTAGFDISQTLIPFSAAGSNYGEAFIVGLLNTLVVAVIGIFFATILGFLIGIARLSKNWIVSSLAMVYVEVIRNIPLLLQLLFWYIAVLTPLPAPRQSIDMGAGFFINSRGLFMPRRSSPATPRPFSWCSRSVSWARWVSVLGAAPAGAVRAPVPVGSRRSGSWSSCRSWCGAPSPCSAPTDHLRPAQEGHLQPHRRQPDPARVRGAAAWPHIYTAAFIAEVVRAGIMAVSRGQTEAASSLGLKPGHTLRLVVIPRPCGSSSPRSRASTST
jgi:general L-amino acid transport system permease protein